MIAICHKCGAPKQNPIQSCTACKTVPKNDDDIALAFMLTDQFLAKDKLIEASQMIRGGKRIELPSSVRIAVLAALQGARARQTSPPLAKSSEFSAKGIAIFAALVATVVLMLWYIEVHAEDEAWRTSNGSHKIESLREYVRSYPKGDHVDEAKQQVSSLADKAWEAISKSESKSEIQKFLRDYSETSKTEAAESRIVEIADLQWATISKSESKSEIQKFLRDYSETSKTAAAESRIVEIADLQWAAISNSRSLSEINKFIRSFPETTKLPDAEARIQELYNDLDWVKEQDDLEHYRRFISRYPSHPQIAAVEKRIIDLEVKDIAAGKYGKLPKAQPLSYGGFAANVEVENKTGYELTVRYSGPESKKLIIPVSSTRTISLLPGDYEVAASVSAANVTNYYGRDSMQGGSYSSNFFIKSGFGSSSFSPSYEPTPNQR